MKYFSSHATIYGGIHRYYFNTKCDFKSKTLSIIKCKTENEFLSDCCGTQLKYNSIVILFTMNLENIQIFYFCIRVCFSYVLISTF